MSSHLTKIDLNILPDAYRRKQLSPKHAALLLALVTAIALAFILYQVTFDALSQTSEMQDKLDNLNQQIELKIVEIGNKNNKLAIIQEYQTISVKRDNITEDLQNINYTAVGSDITATSVSHLGNSITVNYQATISSGEEYLQLSVFFDSYCEALEQKERFSSAKYDMQYTYPPPDAISIDVTIEIIE